MRRMRRTKALRDLIRETDLGPAHLVQPLFVVAGEGVREPVPSMPVDSPCTNSDSRSEIGVKLWSKT